MFVALLCLIFYQCSISYQSDNNETHSEQRNKFTVIVAKYNCDFIFYLNNLKLHLCLQNFIFFVFVMLSNKYIDTTGIFIAINFI
jgi:hypothetical protein